MKKNFTQQAAVAILIVCSLTVGCSQSIPSNNTQTNDTQTVNEQQIVIGSDLGNTNTTESTQASEAAPQTQPSSSIQFSEPSQTQTKPSSEVPETTPSVKLDEAILNEENSSQAEPNDVQVLNGYKMQDGMDTPVHINFEMTDIKRGDEAYTALSANKPDLAAAESGMEYIVVTFNVTYESGEADMLLLEESHASLDSAKLYFYLSNGDSNAEQLTDLLSDNIYSLSLNKGSSRTGSVAFLHKADNDEPLRFIGFGSILEFSINK